LDEWTHPVGDIHRRKTLDIINEHARDGIHLCEIKQKTHFTRQTISAHLKKLRKEHLVRKDKEKRYFPINDDDINISLLSASNTNHLWTTMSSLSSGNRSQTLLNTNKFCKCRFGKFDDTERMIFEFANAIGAIFVFIESMRENEISTVYRNKVNLGEKLIMGSVPFEEISKRFIQLICDKNNFSPGDSVIYLDKIFESYKSVYPESYSSLEKKLREIHQIVLGPKTHPRHKDCRYHRWHERHLYRYGKFYECSKCSQIAKTV
jgi:DNA-binding transcriptional ArsR family regulator